MDKVRFECYLLNYCDTFLENRVLRQISGPKRDANGEWKRLHNEELNSLYHSPNVVRVIKSRRLRWAGLVARMEEDRRTFKILTGTPTGRRVLGRSRHRWEDNYQVGEGCRC